jgi:asparagine synthase (glutamine-hydrolysing)
MCGFAGILTTNLARGSLREAVVRMTGPIAHRGPDDSGEWVDEDAGVALGFRRLAIIDLSAQGHQPMTSATGRYEIIFNGEVFNFEALRRELEPFSPRYRGHSDTEVILAAFEAWGISAAVKKFVGMFAIAVWDRQERSLTLMRDRLGIKPLFVYRQPGLVTFGSEIKALHAGPAFDRAIDDDAVAQYLRYLYVPAPRSIFRNVIKLPPGQLLTIRDASKPLPDPVPYWSVEEAARRGLSDPVRGSDEEVINEFDRQLSDAVRLRMEADVPLGALLSGGIDSSTVVALLQEQSSRPVKTFSVAFDAEEHNEAHHAARLAQHLGTDHTEVLLTGNDALAVVPRLSEIFDEPHADTSQIPAFLICGVARRSVTVALTGDGGDEVYGGYNRYTYGEGMLQRVMRVPRPARRMVAAGIDAISPESWNRAHRFVSPVLPRALRQRLPGEKLHKLGKLMGSDSVPLAYRSLVSAWQNPEALLLSPPQHADGVQALLCRAWPERLLHRMMLTDQLTYLPDDQLAKVDRVSMAVSLEVRVPLLDHRLVEFSWRLPPSMKIRDGKGKWILRQVLYRRVPQAFVERPKMGLSVPLGQWLRGPLRPWAEDLLSTERIEREGMLRAEPIRETWKHLLAGRDESALAIWSMLMLRAWSERWLASQ